MTTNKEQQEAEVAHTQEYLLIKILDGLFKADQIINAVGTKWHEHHIEQVARVGKLVNTLPNPHGADMEESGFRKISHALDCAKELAAKLTSQVASGEAVSPEVVVDTGDGIFYSTHTVHAQIIKGQWKVQVKIGQEKQPPATNEFVAEGCELFTTPSPSNVLVEALRELIKDIYAKCGNFSYEQSVINAEKALATYSASTDSVSRCEHDGNLQVGYDEVTCTQCGWIVPSGKRIGIHEGWFPSHEAHQEFIKYKTYQGMNGNFPRKSS